MAFGISFFCDKCGDGYTIEYATIPSLHKYVIINRIRKSGFTVGKRILCPKCKRGGKKT